MIIFILTKYEIDVRYRSRNSRYRLKRNIEIYSHPVYFKMQILKRNKAT